MPEETVPDTPLATLTDPETGEEYVRLTPEQLRQLTVGAHAHEQTQAELAALKRAEAFRAAGIDHGAGTGKLLFEHYQGDLTADAVKAAAAGYGITPTATTPGATPAGQAPVAPEGPALTPDEQAATAQRQALAHGSSPPSGQPEGDPYQNWGRQVEDRIAKGSKRADALGWVIGQVMESDDPRTFVPQDQIWQGPGQ